MTGDKKVPAWAKAPAKGGLLLLEITKEDGTTSYVSVDKKPGYLLGRNGKDCDVVVAHKSASRVHACIAHHSEGQVYLIDLGSVHGTTLNGETMEPSSQEQLVPGKTTFSIGSCPWTFTLQPAAQRRDRAEEHAGSTRRAHADERDRAHKRQEHPAAQDYRRSRPDQWDPRDRYREPHRHNQAPRAIHEDRYYRDGGRHSGWQERGRGRGFYDRGRGGSYDRRGPPGRHGGYGRPDFGDRRTDDRERYEPRVSPPPEGDPPPTQDEAQNPKRRRLTRSLSAEAASPDRAAAEGEEADGEAENGAEEGRQQQKSRHRHRSKEDRHKGSSRHRDREDDEEYHRRRDSDGRHSERHLERQTRDDRSDQDAEEPAAVRTARERKSGFGDAPEGGAVPFVAGPPMGIADQKKKLLWGNKAQETQEAAQAEKVYGANRWDAAQFSNEQDKEKFIKLLGVKNPVTAAKASAASAEMPEREVLTGDKQEKVLGDVEHHFMQGLRRADGRKVGLGL